MLKKQNSSLRSIALILIVLLAAAAQIFAQKAATYTNPVQAGDYPDPSVIRIGKDFYATATSSEWGPEFPILHSRDLVNWNIVGVVFPKRPEWSVGNYWAPEIWQENGVFYIFYVARKAGGNLCIAAASAAKPTGPYTDHGPLECQEVGSIDAFPIRDENGKLFVIWKEDGNSVNKPTPLWAQELDTKNWKMVGARQEILRNDPETWEGNLVEGPYIIRKNGYFYMFYSGNACYGRSCNYALSVARSKNLLGKWEKNPANPILAANDVWQCPGHGTIVKTPDGADFLLYHAYRKRSDAFNIGREALLDRVEWTKDGWATINNGRGASNTANLPFSWAKQENNTSFIDEFDRSILSPNYQLPLFPSENIDLRAGTLAFGASDTSEAVVATRTVSGDYTATTLIKSASAAADEIVGLAAYSWRGNAVGIGFGAGKISVYRRENGRQEIAASADVANAPNIYLRLTATGGEFYRFAYSLDGNAWTDLGKPVVGSHVEGARVALTHAGKARTARFDWLKIVQN